MNIYLKTACIVAAVPMAIALAACSSRPPVESLAPPPTELPAEPQRPDLMERGGTLPNTGEMPALPPGQRGISIPQTLPTPAPHKPAPKPAAPPKPRVNDDEELKWEGSDSDPIPSRAVPPATHVRRSETPRVLVLVNRELGKPRHHDEMNEETRWRVQERFDSAFRTKGYAIVDAEVALQACRAKDAETCAATVDMAALRKQADWLVELLVAPSDADSDEWVVSAKAVDLASSKLLGRVSSRELPQPIHIPGAPAPEGKSLDTMATEVADALADRASR